MPPIGGGAGAVGVSACITGSSCGVIATIPRAAWRIATEAGESGSAVTSGVPSSAWARSSSDSGTLPTSGTSS